MTHSIMHSTARSRRIPRTGRGPAGGFAGLVVVVLLTAGCMSSPAQAAPAIITPNDLATNSLAPEAITGPSQSAADAKRDSVYPQIARLSLKQRARPSHRIPGRGASPQTVRTKQGVWMVTNIDISSLTPGSCLKRSAASPAYRICDMYYSEILLLSRDRSRIIRAWPLAWPMQWIQVTRKAVYCGRQGDGGLPNSAVCRIDRKSRKLVAKVYRCGPDLVDCGLPKHVYAKGWPGRWTRGAVVPSPGFSGARLRSGDLRIQDDHGKLTAKLDPTTLAVIH